MSKTLDQRNLRDKSNLTGEQVMADQAKVAGSPSTMTPDQQNEQMLLNLTATGNLLQEALGGRSFSFGVPTLKAIITVHQLSGALMGGILVSAIAPSPQPQESKQPVSERISRA